MQIPVKRSTLIVGLLTLIFAACSGDEPPTPAPVLNPAEFRRALQSAGVAVETAMGTAPELVDGEVQLWTIRDELIYIYSFSGEASRERAARVLMSTETFPARPGQELQIWEREAFLVLYPGSDGGTILLISGLLGDAKTQQLSGPDEPYPPAISAAQQALAVELGLSPVEVKVIDYQPVIWPDSCLGLPVEGEGCFEAETSGWRIELRARGESYRLHTDEIGAAIRRSN